MNAITNISRAHQSGDASTRNTPSSMTQPERLARFLGWFSVGLGVAELVAPGRITRALGMEGKEGLVRAYGVRELAAGVPTLSLDPKAGLVSRVLGDGLDLATLATALRPTNPKRDAALIAMAMVVGITVLDIIAAAGVAKAQNRTKKLVDEYRVIPPASQDVRSSRGTTRSDVETPPIQRAEEDAATTLPN
ncbi:hypothetical protein C1T17_02985 [Sphingobium sp. SCG-1]|uniref:hypothetical protein n=1 Tax=Sphingobium sp. SCG-1 TaxID=2072936 RepID=UPI000CD6B363|nr:hypothetical protein [Sphingobium sp. SCG-1]AUW57207.1 hypothetical protein C1T17_02985 [Sphingobium sp. SCG-1]